jgi:hypothetical protein
MKSAPKEMPFSKEAMQKVYEKKNPMSMAMEEMSSEDPSEEKEYEDMEVGELSPEEKHLIMMFRSKKEKV